MINELLVAAFSSFLFNTFALLIIFFYYIL